MDKTLKQLYGEHMDYDVLDGAFRAIIVTIASPYMIGDMKKVLVCKAKIRSMPSLLFRSFAWSLTFSNGP